MRTMTVLFTLAGCAALCAPAQAQVALPPQPVPGVMTAMPAPPPLPPEQAAAYARAREQWLVDCRMQQNRGRDGGVAGAVIGGVVGGVAGNVIAGRGDKTVGTLAGAALGAVAGAAIGNAQDNRQAKDYCESYLDYYSRPGYGAYPGGAYGYPVAPAAGSGYPAGAYPVYGYAVPMMMVPVAQPAERRNCTRTITTEEWVTVPVRQRTIPRRAPRDKRVRIVPDKRLPAD